MAHCCTFYTLKPRSVLGRGGRKPVKFSMLLLKPQGLISSLPLFQMCKSQFCKTPGASFLVLPSKRASPKYSKVQGRASCETQATKMHILELGSNCYPVLMKVTTSADHWSPVRGKDLTTPKEKPELEKDRAVTSLKARFLQWDPLCLHQVIPACSLVSNKMGQVSPKIRLPRMPFMHPSQRLMALNGILNFFKQPPH